MTTVTATPTRAPAEGKFSWLLLITGILWLFIGLFVLQADFDSALLIGYLVAFWLIFAGVAEFIEGVATASGWKWLHFVLGVLFVIGGIMALMSPFQTFTILAALLGIFLVIKGSFDFVIAIAERHVADLWWLMMIVGIIEILLGVWAMGYPGRSAALLIFWIGLGAIIRGIMAIAMAFMARHIPEEELAV
jgi:uncharacterized membrane protein HdeD (DUF308 family)